MQQQEQKRDKAGKQPQELTPASVADLNTTQFNITKMFNGAKKPEEKFFD